MNAELTPSMPHAPVSAPAETANIKYVFMDIVGYSHKRSVEAQTDIIATLNEIVRTAVTSERADADKTIYIPTGDGLCIALIEQNLPYDLPLVITLSVLRLLHEANEGQSDPMRRFQVRIGINENTDNMVVDINGRRNVAGAGINYTQRVMSNADGGNVLVGQTIYERLSQREKYMSKFKEYPVTVKHGVQLRLHQYVDESLVYLNSEIPETLRPKSAKPEQEPKFTKLVAYLIGYLVKHNEFIVSHLDYGQNSYSLFALMALLAEESVTASKATEFDLPSPSFLIDFNGDLGGQFEYLQRQDMLIICGFVDLFYRFHVARFWGDKYLNFLTTYLRVSEAGVEKMKSEWPEIAQELGILEH